MSKLTEQVEIITGMIAKHHEAIRSLHDLKASLTHEAQHARLVTDDVKKGDLTTKANMPNHTLAISKSDLGTLKRMYDAAMAGNRERFEFKGQVLLTQYAKYVIEYTESGFDSTRR